MEQYLNGKTILITGGTGSFSSHFISYLLRHRAPRCIRVFSRDEHKQTELLKHYGGIRGDDDSGHIGVLRGFIGDIRDRNRLRMAMEGVDVVVHAAALKQVQSCEYNPLETIKTNIQGSANVVETALEADVDRVLGISTDKAVSPLNLYGSTKLCMERIFTHGNSYRGARRTKFACTRYGNVADSRGTVVHIWRGQVEHGSPISVTSEECTRFWITMAEANGFVMDTLEMMGEFGGGEIFCPMMPSVSLDTIRHAVAPSSHINIVGMRLGDKVHEALCLKEELQHAVKYRNRIVVCPADPSWPYYVPNDVEQVPAAYDLTSKNNEEYLDIPAVRRSLGLNGVKNA